PPPPPPPSVHNYFHLTRVDGHSAKSEGPHMAGSFAMDRVYGGLAATQALATFRLLHPSLRPHTINYKYVAAGRVDSPMEYYSSHHDEGKIVAIQARQGTTVVGTGHIRYSALIDLLPPLQYPFPEDVDGPEEYPEALELMREIPGYSPEMINALSQVPLDIHPVESPLFPSSDVDRVCLWTRFNPRYHSDLLDVDGLQIVLFLSDFNILQVASEIYQKNKVKMSAAASLHHTVWFHQTEDIDPLEWYLTVVEAPVITLDRARLTSHLFDRRKRCILSVVQEGYIQKKRDSKI
ncbi:hypothetical protein PENTCL1PPCAC_25963, partial [Pristionchus entomophagus]